VPTKAQDRMSGGPFGALLILLSLLIGSGTAAAAGLDLRPSGDRLAPGRASAQVALLPQDPRNASDEDATGAGAALPPSAPGPAGRSLWTRPAAKAAVAARISLPSPADPSNRARAPPAV
jgi:hypothetical protein